MATRAVRPHQHPPAEPWLRLGNVSSAPSQATVHKSFKKLQICEPLEDQQQRLQLTKQRLCWFVMAKLLVGTMAAPCGCPQHCLSFQHSSPPPRCCSLTKPQHPEEGKNSISFSEGRTGLRAVKPSHPSCCRRASGGWQDTGHPSPAASGSIRPWGTFLSGRCTSLWNEPILPKPPSTCPTNSHQGWEATGLHRAATEPCWVWVRPCTKVWGSQFYTLVIFLHYDKHFLMNAHIKLSEFCHFEAHCHVTAELPPQVGAARRVRLMPWGSTEWVGTSGCSICTHGSSARINRGRLPQMLGQATRAQTCPQPPLCGKPPTQWGWHLLHPSQASLSAADRGPKAHLLSPQWWHGGHTKEDTPHVSLRAFTDCHSESSCTLV